MAGHELGGQRLAEADQHGSEVGEGQAGEPADDGGAEHLDGQQREQDGVDAEQRRQEDPGQGGE